MWQMLTKTESTKYVRYSHIEDAPTVEAIPVEWLLNHIPNDEQMERYNKKLIEYLVIGWREANERRKREM